MVFVLVQKELLKYTARANLKCRDVEVIHIFLWFLDGVIIASTVITASSNIFCMTIILPQSPMWEECFQFEFAKHRSFHRVLWFPRSCRNTGPIRNVPSREHRAYKAFQSKWGWYVCIITLQTYFHSHRKRCRSHPT
jgi:hypothetical protein